MNGGNVGGTTGSCECTSCNPGFDGLNCANPHNVQDMEGLFNTVSNYQAEIVGGIIFDKINTGSYTHIMATGDTVILAVGLYKCSEGSCAAGDFTPNMLYTHNLEGELKCADDNSASCVFDGEHENSGMTVKGTGSGKFTVRAITFFNGVSMLGGGGMNIKEGATVDLILCHFMNCASTHPSVGGGAILVSGSETTVNTYGLSFVGNEAINDGKDVWNNPNNPGNVIVNETCPEPYSLNTPNQGKTNTQNSRLRSTHLHPNIQLQTHRTKSGYKGPHLWCCPLLFPRMSRQHG